MKTNFKKINTLLAAVMVLAVLSACASAATEKYSGISGGVSSDAVMEMPAAEAPMMAPEASYNEVAAVPEQRQASPDRIVITNVDLSIVVDDPAKKMEEIGRLSEAMGGYVVSSNIYQTTLGNSLVVPEGSINIRVPAKDLDAAMESIKKDAVEVQYENRSGQDVTDQYIDLQSRLKAKQAAETKLYQILDKAETAEDTLLVFNQLTSVQSEIEVLKGQINYYDTASSLSSVNVRLVADESIQPIEVGGWKPQGVVKEAIQSLIKFFQGFVDFLIWLVILVLPVLLLAILVLWIVWKITGGFWKKLFKSKIVEPKE